MAEKNAGRLLYEQLREWKSTPSGARVLEHRRKDGAWWGPHVQAVQWLAEVEEQLQRIRERDPEGAVPFAEEAIERIRRGIFSTDSMMEDNAERPRIHFTSDDLTALHLLASLWQVDGPQNPGVAVDLLEVARDIEDLLIAAIELDSESRDYMLDLVKHLQSAINSVSVHGIADVQRLADQLNGALIRYLGDAPEEQVEQTRNVIQRLAQNIKLFLGLVPPTVKAIESAQALFGGTPALPPGS